MNSLLLAEEAAKPVPEISGKVYPSKPGPWGNLFYYYIYLEAPADFVNRFPMPNSVTRWSFPGSSVSDLKKLFTKAGLAQALQDYLLDGDRLLNEDGILTVFPPLPDLEALTQEQRSVIYSELGRHVINPYHHEPVLIHGGDIEDWLKGSRLRDELRESIKRMTYMRGNQLAFSDLAAVLNYTSSAEEAGDFFKTITRMRTMIVRLQLSEDDDLEALAGYWTGRHRYKDILPILSSVAETEEVAMIDVVHLLPSMARRYLYTYPPVDLAMNGRMPDCHWTSLNFFNHWARQYYLDTRLAASAILQDYEEVKGAYEFGDVLMFMDGDSGNAIHSCVYVADDIVFTKNGENMVAPWLLMKLEDVRKVYFHANPGRVDGYRLKRRE
ncbi:hypothetical protein [Phragmitibacter flavus]|uniref:hypothetical protein n=1 Tax=Phragmitibacter flavus TaxID=2576071 RepID=UPI0010FE3C06|nr:hypothetical protein [Phragmitibacter flavus]